eukprot:6855999-Alexandrium_andersonii.AAC.1
MVGQAAHVFDGFVRAVEGPPENRNVRKGILKRFEELANRAMEDYTSEFQLKGRWWPLPPFAYMAGP